MSRSRRKETSRPLDSGKSIPADTSDSGVATTSRAAPTVAGERGTASSAAAEQLEGWNRFWFRPLVVDRLRLLRIVLGVSGVWYFGWLLADGATWFGAAGLASVDTVHESTSVWYHLSPLLALPPLFTTVVTIVGLVASALQAAGLYARVASPVMWLAALCLMHRASLLNGLFETALAPLALYGMLGTLGARAGQGKRTSAARVALRLTQVHLAALYASIGLMQLGSVSWWNGDGAWRMIARSDSRLVALTFLTHPVVLSAITHALVAFALLLPALIWRRPLRLWFVRASVLYWLFVALTLGQLGFAGLMGGATWGAFGAADDE